MVSDDQIFASFRNMRGTPRYFHNMLLDVLAKYRLFGVYTFFVMLWNTHWQTSSGYGFEYEGIILEKKFCYSCSAGWLAVYF